MVRTVRREFIDEYTQQNRPNGVGKLSIASGIPTTSIEKIRKGRIPLDPSRRERLAKALGVSEAELFPPAGKRVGKTG